MVKRAFSQALLVVVLALALGSVAQTCDTDPPDCRGHECDERDRDRWGEMKYDEYQAEKEYQIEKDLEDSWPAPEDYGDDNYNESGP